MAKSPIKLHSYRLLSANAQELGISATDINKMRTKPLRLILCGECFFICARDPIIKVGELNVTDFAIKSDMCSIECFLYQQPPEGAVISVDYGMGETAEMAELFSINKLDQDGPS